MTAAGSTLTGIYNIDLRVVRSWANTFCYISCTPANPSLVAHHHHKDFPLTKVRTTGRRILPGSRQDLLHPKEGKINSPNHGPLTNHSFQHLFVRQCFVCQHPPGICMYVQEHR